MSARGPSFQASLIHGLKGLGLSGISARVSVDGDALRIEGAKGGVLEVPSQQVERLRMCQVRGKYGTFYEARLWRRGIKAPLLLLPAATDRGYAAVMRAFASRLAASDGLERIYCGDSRTNSLILIVLSSGSIALLALALLAYAVVIRSEILLAAALLLGLLDIFMTIALIRKTWPRPVRHLDELDRVFPPANGRLS